MPTPPATLPPLIGRLTLIAEQLLPLIERLPKQQKVLLGRALWEHLDATILSVFTALNGTGDCAARTRAAAHFDQFKWYLRLLDARKLVSRGWLMTMSPDIVEVGKMLGGFARAGRA